MSGKQDAAAGKVQAAYRSKAARGELEERKKLMANEAASGPAAGDGLKPTTIMKLAAHCLTDKFVGVSVLLVGLLQAVVIFGLLLTVGNFVDDLTTTDTSGSAAVVSDETIEALAGYGIVLSVLSYAKVYLVEIGGDRLENSLRKRLIETVSLKPMQWYDNRVADDLQQQLGPDVDLLVNDFYKNGIQAFWNFWQVLVTLVLVAIINETSMGVMLALIPLLGILVAVHSVYQKRFASAFDESTKQCNTEIGEFVDKIRTIRACATEKKEKGDYVRSVDAASRAYQKLAYADAAFAVANGFLATMVMCVLLWYNGEQVKDNKMTVGKLIVSIIESGVAIYFQSMLARNIKEIIDAKLQSGGVVELLDDFYSTEDEDVSFLYEGKVANFADESSGTVEFSGVIFKGLIGNPSYNCLTNFSAVIPAGRSTLFIGQAGCGKSNIPLLLLRYYRPQGGTVSIDGVNIEDYDISYARQVMLITTEPVLFSGSVAYNIAYCSIADGKGVDMKQVELAAKSADAHTFTSLIPGGYTARLGEGTVEKLDRSQMQRICIARCFYANPAVICLQDPVSLLLDSEAAKVRMAIRRMLRNPVRRTGVIIAHKKEDSEIADMACTMMDGKAVESGEKDKLLADPDSMYAKFVSGQTTYGASAYAQGLGKVAAGKATLTTTTVSKNAVLPS